MKRERNSEMTEGEKMDETLSESEENMNIGANPTEEIVSVNYSPGTTHELLQNLSGEDWADTATPLSGSPLKNQQLELGSKPTNMGMVRLSSEGKEKNTFEGNKTIILDTLDPEGWQEFLSKFNRKVARKMDVAEFKEELWDIVVEFGKPILMTTELDKDAREELLSKMVHMREKRPNTEPKERSTLKKKNESKNFKARSKDTDKFFYYS